MRSSRQPNNPGSTDRFLRLLLAAEPKIRGFIFSLLPNWHDADEVYQDTSLVLWEKFGEYRPGTNFCAWACQIAWNKVRNFRSRQATALRLFSDALLEAVAEERLHRSDWDRRRDALAACCEKLRVGDRDLLERCYQRSTTIKQVAAQLSRPVDTVYKSLKRIRHSLYLCVHQTLAREDS
jgi:RNA polymerase sigma-70 factor, ECF subfamily